MPDWKPEIRQRLASLSLAPTREAAIVEELAQHLDDCYAELLSGGATEEAAYRAALAELSDSELLARELRRVERQIEQEPIILTVCSASVSLAGAMTVVQMFAPLITRLRSHLSGPFGLRELRKSFQPTLNSTV